MSINLVVFLILFFCFPVFLCVFRPSVRPSVYLSVCLSVCLFIRHCFFPDLPSYLSGLLGIHQISGKLYGVSRNGDDYLESIDWTGKFWKQINSSVWKSVVDDASMMTVVEIPHIPITGLMETDLPFSVLTLKADIGDEYTGERSCSLICL